MGINGSHKLLTYWLTDVTIKELFSIATIRCELALESGIERSRKPTIDVDISWLYRRSSCTGKDALELTFNICLELVKEGFLVELICDGSKRHYTKRATIARQVKQYKAQLNIFEKRAELMKVAEHRRITDSLQERESYEADEKSLSNSIKRMENQFQAELVDVGQCLYDNLQDAIALLSDEMIGESGGYMTCYQAKYQADSAIAYRAVHGISDVVLMNDSDLAVHVGNHCLGIKDFKFIESLTGSNSLREMQLFSPSYDTIRKVAQEIGVDVDKSKHRIRKPEFPVFENINYTKLRCLMAVGLGCDVTAGKNVKGVTARSLWLFLQTFQPTKECLYDLVMNHFIMKHFKLKCMTGTRTVEMIKFVDMIEVYVEAFMYEPATYYVGENNQQATLHHIYIHGKVPLSLHPYVKDFAENNQQIIIRQDNITMIGDCVGAGAGPHCYVCDDSSTTCNTCRMNICSLCIFTSNSKPYCVNCYVSEKHFSTAEEIEKSIPIALMREQLLEIGLDVSVSESAADIIDWYDALIIKKDNIVYANNIVDDITMPTEDSLYINDMTVVNEFDVKEGGRFIRNEQLPVGSKIQLLLLLADLVTITDTNNNNELNASETKCYSVIPKIIVHFAKNARIGSGYRLLKRCIRHGLDPRATSILHASIKVIQYNDEIGLFIKHRIRASMKTDVYDVQVCFTRTVIVSCTCSCKAGCFGKGKVICVHILPTIFQYTLLLFDGLSEHILCELANDWNLALERSLSSYQTKDMLYSLCKLEQATGKVDSRNNFVSGVEFLKKYQVGTENSKIEPPPPKDPSKLGPLRNMDFRSPTVIAKNLLNNFNNCIASDIDVDSDTADLDPPSYTTIRTVLCHLNLLIPNMDPNYSTESYIGFRLLFLRENNENKLLSESHIQQLFLDVQESLTLADSTIRRGNEIDRVQVTEPTTKTTTETPIETPAVDENVANVANVDHNLMDMEAIELDKPKKNYHMGRCAIDCCQNIKQKLIRVPPVQNPKQFTDTTSVDVIKTYYKKSFLRKEWLRRINLNPNDTRKDLRICKTHTLQQMSFTISWKDKDGSCETFDTILVVPRMDHEEFSKTRTDKRKRPVYVRSIYNNQRTSCRTPAVNNTPKKHRKCDFIKCTMQATSGNHNVSFRRVPPPLKLYECTSRRHLNSHRKREAIRKFFRSEFLRRIGLSSNEKRKDLRICSNHQMEVLPRSIDWLDMNNKKCTEVVNFPVPAAFGPMSDFVVNETTLRSPKGVGITRQTTNYMNNVLTLSQQPGNNDISWGIALVHSLQDEEDRMQPVDVNDPNIPNNRRPIYCSKTKIKRLEELEETALRISQIVDRDVCNETGYRTKQSLISTIIIVYNGDIKSMCKTVSQLTWFEEWYFVFEKIWGKANKRYFDLGKKYKRSAATLRLIYDAKIKIILEARRRWPKYATMNEDTILRNNRWNKHYAGKRVVMWDNTNIRLYKSSNAEAQRNTYSTYYAGNVGKGAVFVQLCGWMGTHELWCGAVSDSEYMIRSGVLEQQNEYVPKFDPQNADVPFMNILDKGYRINSAAWRTGGQFVLQPAFAKSDRKFNALDVIRSAAVASDRGGNERAVRIAKLCGSLKDGLNGHGRPDRLCDIWLAWSFLTNFMFKPVL